ncbi:hypothetical protein F4820DRAFT_316552 [Hypoxylon rubiginosum]|uniref:Uncharacterized protein n=1 Tax=Hypoxylon rubiginosum TaxID=110542 RepID=A0ACB9ZE85_9PEZI|nr:hypothetical protein F4820DRAFT_316552 [Hypoxylon rubiginosum]
MGFSLSVLFTLLIRCIIDMCMGNSDTLSNCLPHLDAAPCGCLHFQGLPLHYQLYWLLEMGRRRAGEMEKV